MITETDGQVYLICVDDTAKLIFKLAVVETL